jgi:hypothetical protein
MNTENMLKVADLIEQYPQQFNMESPRRVDVHTCGTSGCIGGFAGGLLPEKEAESLWLHEIGEKVFGITEKQANDLFYGGNIWSKYAEELGLPHHTQLVDMEHIKPHHAVTMLRNLASGKWNF